MKHFGKNNSIMSDQGFITSDYFENNQASVIYQLFLNDCEQLTKAEVKESQSIASVRILTEQYNILAINKFHQIKNEIPLVLHGSIN